MDERATRDFHDAAPPTASVLRGDPDVPRAPWRDQLHGAGRFRRNPSYYVPNNPAGGRRPR
jgi:hypothetical protein